MAIVVRYFDKSVLGVVDRPLTTVVVEDGSALGLYASLKILLEKRGIPMQTISSLGGDNCLSTMRIKNDFQKLLKDDLPFLFVMGCVSHSFAMCANHAVTILLSYLKGFLEDLTFYFSRSSKRKE